MKSSSPNWYRLINLQSQAQREQIFGGFSAVERAEYEERRKRISDLRTEIAAESEKDRE